MKTMAAGEFKAKCLKVMDRVNKTREPVLITKKGKPVAKLVPADPEV
jgi:prevent-host-death family protein